MRLQFIKKGIEIYLKVFLITMINNNSWNVSEYLYSWSEPIITDVLPILSNSHSFSSVAVLQRSVYLWLSPSLFSKAPNRMSEKQKSVLQCFGESGYLAVKIQTDSARAEMK